MATDFLTNLLDRALERAPVLQRRRPSLFEPTPDTVGLGAMPWGESWGHGEKEPASEVESVGIQDVSALPPTAPTPHRAAAARAAMPMPESMGLDPVRSEETTHPVAPAGNEARRESRQEVAPPPPEQATPLVVRAALPHRVVETIVEKAVEKPGPAVRSVQPSEGRNLVETIVEKAVEKPGPASHFAHPSEGRNPVETIVVGKVEKQGPASWSAHPSEGRTEKPAVVAAPAPFPLQPVLVSTIKWDQTGKTGAPRDVSQQREADTASARPAQPAAPPVLLPLSHPPLPLVRSQSVIVREALPAPTIQVTIGRIEVRATSPSPATPKKAPSKPVAMSLEDYLKQRNEGRR